MPRSSGRLGAPNRQLEGFVIHTNRSSSSRNSQYGYAPSDPFEVLERIPERHAEKSDGTDNENRSSTRDGDEQQQARGIGGTRESEEVVFTPREIRHSSQEESQEGERSSTKNNNYEDTESDFKKRVQTFLVMKVYCYFVHEGSMSLEERANKCLEKYGELTVQWVNKTNPFYGDIFKVFGYRAASVTTDVLMKKSFTGKQAQEDVDAKWMEYKLKTIKETNSAKAAAKNLGNVLGVLQKVYAPLMNRLLPKDTNPASGKNYAHYYELVRRFLYLKLTDEVSASEMERKGDADFRSSLENKNDVPESFVPQHWEAFLFFGVQDEHETGNPEPCIVNLINQRRETNEASTRNPGSREDSRKRRSSTSGQSTTYDVSGLLETIEKKAKNESQKIQHEAEEAILRKIQTLQNCVGMDEELKRRLLEKYTDELEKFHQ